MKANYIDRAISCSMDYKEYCIRQCTWIIVIYLALNAAATGGSHEVKPCEES